ncbi:MAG: hypothetical protein R3Y27_02210 [Clostridia bacterium]
MDRKIKNYVDTLFIDVPKTKKSNKIKNDLIKDMMSHSKDHLSEGRTHAQAYSLTIASFADVDDIIEEAMTPDTDSDDSFEHIYPKNYKKRTRQIEFISIFLFVISPVIFIISALNDLIIVGFFIVPVFAIIGCILSIYLGSLKMHYADNDFANLIKEAEKSIKFATIFVTFIVGLLYCVVGMFTEIWHPTWIIFFSIPITKEIMHTLLEITNLKRGELDEK